MPMAAPRFGLDALFRTLLRISLLHYSHDSPLVQRHRVLNTLPRDPYLNVFQRCEVHTSHEGLFQRRHRDVQTLLRRHWLIVTLGCFHENAWRNLRSGVQFELLESWCADLHIYFRYIFDPQQLCRHLHVHRPSHKSVNSADTSLPSPPRGVPTNSTRGVFTIAHGAYKQKRYKTKLQTPLWDFCTVLSRRRASTIQSLLRNIAFWNSTYTVRFIFGSEQPNTKHLQKARAPSMLDRLPLATGSPYVTQSSTQSSHMPRLQTPRSIRT